VGRTTPSADPALWMTVVILEIWKNSNQLVHRLVPDHRSHFLCLEMEAELEWIGKDWNGAERV